MRQRRAARLESRIVWMFGSPRAGSTWLLQLLTHPLAPDDSAATGVVRRAGAEDVPASGAIPINEPYIPHHLAPALPDELVLNEALPAVTVPALRGGSTNYFLSDAFAGTWRPQLRALVLDRLEAQARAVSAAFGTRDPWLIVKEPNGSLGAEFVISLLPRSRLIFLLRDGREVVDSMVDARSRGGWLASAEGSSGPEGRRALVREESRLWVARTRAVMRAYDAHPPALRLLVRYEELRADPAGVLAGLDDWLERRRGADQRSDAIRWNDFESIPADAKGRGMPLRAAQPGLWRSNLGAEEQEIMRAEMGPTLAELGYSA